jgi:hypothetical protein
LGGGCYGTTWDPAREAVYLLVHRAQCRGEYVKDLEIGAVDELLVGVSVVRDKDKGGEIHFWNSPPAFRLSTLL